MFLLNFLIFWTTRAQVDAVQAVTLPADLLHLATSIRVRSGHSMPIRALSAALICTALNGAALAATPATSTPEDEAFSFAWRVGDLLAYAKLCGAPSSTYAQVVKEARSVLPRVYQGAGLRVADIEQDIAAARESSLAAQPDPRGWPSCTAFRRVVSSIRNDIASAKRGRAKPLAPYDTDDWQDRVRAADR